MHCGFDPTALIGGYVAELDGNARTGRGPWVVAEVDESDGSLVYIRPHGAVLTSLDGTDHRDFYTSQDHLTETFTRFLTGVPDAGFIAACIASDGFRLMPPASYMIPLPTRPRCPPAQPPSGR